jgi:hypothetical protein
VRRGYARSRERDDAIRASLRPLAPGERPPAVTVAAVLATLIAVGNLLALVTGVADVRTSRAGGLAFCALMALAAVGLWRRRYWAVLGFEVLLGLAIMYAALALLVASNLAAVLSCLAVIAVCAPLFWLLIRAMARIQLTARGPDGRVG